MSETQQSILNKASVDKFILALNLPPILKSIDSRTLSTKRFINLDALQYSIEGTVAPAINIQSNTIPFAGQNLEVTSHKRDPHQKTRVRFTVDNRFRNYWVLWKWLDILNDTKRGIANADKLSSVSLKPTLHDYQTDISIFTMDEFNKPVVEFKYYKAFITSLDGIEVDYQNNGQIVCSFEFAFSQFHMDLLPKE
jgi:hypothetical protein